MRSTMRILIIMRKKKLLLMLLMMTKKRRKCWTKMDLSTCQWIKLVLHSPAERQQPTIMKCLLPIGMHKVLTNPPRVCKRWNVGGKFKVVRRSTSIFVSRNLRLLPFLLRSLLSSRKLVKRNTKRGMKRPNFMTQNLLKRLQLIRVRRRIRIKKKQMNRQSMMKMMSKKLLRRMPSMKRNTTVMPPNLSSQLGRTMLGMKKP
mmetsp:Transcript_25204/g.39096  ORF Transcript_25204/g.39096 Transcript_25204/m.39096 type:complete len:202 (+) Transcript_25204:2004-2609(+)